MLPTSRPEKATQPVDTSGVRVRPARLADLPAIRALYRDTILHVNARDYNELQLRTWSARADDAARWEQKLQVQQVFVSENADVITGFTSIDSSGYVDLMFVHREYLGLGIASILLQTIEAAAERMGCGSLHADVSITARPFFERAGFRVVCEQEVRIGEVPFINFRMEKPAPGQAQPASGGSGTADDDLLTP